MARIDLPAAIALLKTGDVVAIPTETVYGLAGRIDEPTAIAKIFDVKRRPFFDPLIVHVGGVAAARALTSAWTSAHEALAARFWPGPLTLVCPKTPATSDLISSGLDTVGLRCPRHPLARAVINGVGVPLAAPSANMFGRTSPTRAAHVEAEFAGRVPVLDGGDCDVGVESTVVLVTPAEIQILRPGGVSALEIERCLADAGLARKVARRASVRSPGHAEAHYRPANPVIAVHADFSAIELARRARALTGSDAVRWLNWPSSAPLAARTLYAELRHLSEAPGVICWRPADLDRPGWEAILDRVERATTTAWT